MVLDHSGPDLALILYGAHLKLALLGALVARVALGFAGGVAAWLGLLGGLAAFAVAVGIVESTMARLRMPRVPQFLLAASVLSALALVLPVR
jgi:formate hydrogenlyase subunit 4